MNKNYTIRPLLPFLCFLLVCSCNCSTPYYTFADYEKVPKIDAHFHYRSNSTYFMEVASAINFKLLSPNIDPGSTEIIDSHLAITKKIQAEYPGQFAYFTTFNASGFEQPGFAEATIAYIDKAIKEGAKGVKIWKNIGMEIRDKEGNYILPDNPVFDPIYSHLEEKQIPLMAHIGEPHDCWLPVDEMASPGNANYFRDHTQYHMYLHPEMPSYEEHIQARNNILKKHPKLHFIAAHLGSEEWSVEKLAGTLDEFPWIMVDLSARTLNLQAQSIKEYDKVRDFMIRHADRIMYGSDGGVGVSDSTDNSYSQWARKLLQNEWIYYATDSLFYSEEFSTSIKGLHLPKEVIDKLYYKNASVYFNP